MAVPASALRSDSPRISGVRIEVDTILSGSLSLNEQRNEDGNF
jgi:hypothetical protein